jgi:nucleoside-diphosphate-sugar epimerase
MGKRYLVTGGGGFVGKALSTELRRQGHSVVSVARGRYPELEALGIETRQVDIGGDPTSWSHFLQGCDGVFHTAAKVDMWGKYEDFLRSNVIGTRNVMAACRSAGVKHLVFTSSPSVVHDGSNLRGIDESYPYPRHFDAFYAKTKATAEREVLAADSEENLRTVALRPHLIWGPNDTNLIPTILERARAGRLVRIGSGNNLVDLTFIDDCVQAHIRAMEALERTPDKVGGNVYFISQGDPVLMWSWIDDVLAANNLPRVSRAIPTWVAQIVAVLMESLSILLNRVGIAVAPLLTRFLVSEMSTDHYFDISRARNDLGFAPSCSVSQALTRTFAKGS